MTAQEIEHATAPTEKPMVGKGRKPGMTHRSCGEWKLVIFMGSPVQLVEGPLAGRYHVYCDGCGEHAYAPAEVAVKMRRGRGFGYALTGFSGVTAQTTEEK